MSHATSHGSRDRAIEEGWKRQIMRVIAHVDLDAFYSQVEVKNNPEQLRDKPVGVVQYNPYGDLATHTPEENRVFNDSNGSLIAVSYEARKFGVKRNMRGDEARKHCPELQLVQVPTAHGKADLTHYRSAGKQVTDILARLAVCEKASIDECYLDITAEARRRAEEQEQLVCPVNPHQVHISGQEGLSTEEWYQRPTQAWGEGERLLACGAAAVADLRAAVQAELGFSCSAGIAHCKILAKLASGLHKPSQQTLVIAAAVPGLLSDLPIPKLRQLGGKFGDEVMRQLELQTIFAAGQLASIPKPRLESLFGGPPAQRLFELAHGIDTDEVKQRTLPKSIGCGKTFQGPNKLRNLPDVLKWLTELGHELEERVIVDRAENAREPKLLTVHAGQISRSGPLRRATAAVIAEDSLALLKKWTCMTPGWSINGMSVCVSNFVAAPTGKSTLTRFFGAPAKKARLDKSNDALDSSCALKMDASVPAMSRSNNDDRQAAQQDSAPLQLPEITSRRGSDCEFSNSEATPTASPTMPALHEGNDPSTRPRRSQPTLRNNQHEDRTIPASQGCLTASASDTVQSSSRTRSNIDGDATVLMKAGNPAQQQVGVYSQAVPLTASNPVSNERQPPRSDSSSQPGCEQEMPRVPSWGPEAIAGSDSRIDPEVLASLPPDIQRELRLASMAQLGNPKKSQNQHKNSQGTRKLEGSGKSGKATIGNYFLAKR